ncbi:uncharacterized protein A1O9_08462 [Exophiala aquamarina CBS 119918]|uniref:Uncharacterized protein n=1 Tax=Exophiala aquamarina CBS 119918 TaxID=1182545 RepID=A0A072P7L0_9EURO|nr:uncharacterized protein A1O9_08462 [Exophiala aquamarina CBS 119918]KEF55712.1 hypothetical protein A1O9_08462 [Exophiala aquamarina CBS 119918]
MATAAQPVYFELSWSILSTIGLVNTLFGLLVGGITTFSPICAVPIITSLSCAIANGLCYYAFYNESYPVTNRAVASVFADIAWMAQEAGYSFYSYIILTRMLRRKSLYIFTGLFWFSMLGILSIRVSIAVLRVGIITGSNDKGQKTINSLHVGYFVLIATVECISAFFLLRTFHKAKVMSRETAIRTDLLRHLMRSTEGRLALLAILGTMRAITYSFQASAQSATGIASQLDRFAYTLECMFPIMML